jgi:hypothetical protein
LDDVTISVPSICALNSGGINVASEPENEDAREVEDNGVILPLPITQQRIPGRIWKRSRLFDAYEVD